MELSKDTWHFRNWEYWLAYSDGKRARKYRGEFHSYAYDEEIELHRKEGLYVRSLGDGTARIYRQGRQANLCMYFWAAVLRAPILRAGRWLFENPIFSTPLIIIALIGIIGSLVHIFNDNITQWWHPYWNIVLGLIITAAGIAVFFGLMFVWLEWAWPKIDSALQARHMKKKREEDKEPNIFVEHVKATKSKICPILEFKDPRSDEERTASSIS